MLEQVDRLVHHDCQDDEKLIVAYRDIGVGPAVVFDGGAFTDPVKLRAFAKDLIGMAVWLAVESEGAGASGEEKAT